MYNPQLETFLRVADAAYFTAAENSGVDTVSSASYTTIGGIKELEPDAVVIEDGFTVSERSVADAAEDVEEWLSEPGF